MLNITESSALGQAIADLVEQRGLGALSKKDYELLVFHHLGSAQEQQGQASNYELANRFKVTETKIKALRLEASLRHQPADHKAVLHQIVQRFIDVQQRASMDAGQLSITLEDPVERREFEHAVKRARYTVEYGLNREILKIDALALFAIIVQDLNLSDDAFKKIVQTHVADKKQQLALLDKALTWPQRMDKLRSFLQNNSLNLASFLASALPFMK